MKTTLRSNEKNQMGINKKMVTVRDDKNGFFYTFSYEFPMSGAEQCTASFKQADRFGTKESAMEYAKAFINA